MLSLFTAKILLYLDFLYSKYDASLSLKAASILTWRHFQSDIIRVIVYARLLLINKNVSINLVNSNQLKTHHISSNNQSA